MKRFSTLALGLTMFLALPVALSAQAKPDTSATSLEKQLIGTWEGPYQSDQAPPGGLRLVIARDSTWKVTLGVISDQEIPAGEVNEFRVDGGRISWVQDIMGMICRSSAELSAGTLRGESNCEQGGAVAITATFVLLKK